MWIDFLVGIVAGALTTALIKLLTRAPARMIRVNGEDVAWLDELEEAGRARA